MSKHIEAIYENGVFKPLRPVEWPEGATVFVEPAPTADELAEQLRQQGLADGLDPARIEEILVNFRLLWRSYDTLTPEQKLGLEEARFDQVNFFRRGSVE